MEEISVKVQHQWITSITLVFNCQSSAYMQCFSQSFTFTIRPPEPFVAAAERGKNAWIRHDWIYYLIDRGSSAIFFSQSPSVRIQKNAKPKQSWKKDFSCGSNETGFHMKDFSLCLILKVGILKLGNEGLKILLIIITFILSWGWRPSSSCCVFMMKLSRNTNWFWRCSLIMSQL